MKNNNNNTIIIIINSISNLIKSLIKIHIKYCQKLDFEAFPQYSIENLKHKIINKNNNFRFD